MKFKLLFLTLFIIISFFVSGFLFAQTLDHTVFLKELENSNDYMYNVCLKKYDDYLKKHPNNVQVHIEKCKFIQYAQYDAEDEYNPNQDAFDSCSAELVKMFPQHPEVLIFQTTYLWGDELKDVFKNAKRAIDENPEEWSKTNLGILYYEMSKEYYSDESYQLALIYIEKAIDNDSKYESDLEYARILIQLKRPKDALDVLSSGKDTTKITWQLSEKAELFLELKAYKKALEIYNLINKIDSTYNVNSELAITLEKAGEYGYARQYLVEDTARNWGKEAALKKLLIHDLKYQNGATCISTYNAYRDNGYLADPLGFYRVQLFLSHPLQAWKFRDILSILSLIVAFLLLLIIPSIWILPVYFIGHHWQLLAREKSYESLWGLKIFWFVSSGYLIAIFLATMAEPEYLYSIFNSYNYEVALGQENLGLLTLLFVVIFALFGLASLYKISPKILLCSDWSIKKSIFTGIGILIVFRITVAIYVRVGVNHFGISMDDLTSLPNILLSSRQDIVALIETYGKWIGFILLCVLVPFNEEIVFRGVVLDSCQRYINFNAANIIQASLFATIHMSLFLFPIYFLFGMTTGIMRKKSGGLLPGFVFHALNNVLAISLLLVR